MDETALVSVCEAGCDIGGDLLRFRVAKRLVGLKAIFERAARKVLEDHVRPPVRAAVVIETTDVLVRERGDGASLALEAERVSVGAEELDRDVAVELRVMRQPDLRHPARAELLLEAISAADGLAHLGE